MTIRVINWYRPPVKPVPNKNKVNDPKYKAEMEKYNNVIRNPPKLSDGVTVDLQPNETAPFLGDITKEKEVLPSICTNLFKAPMCSHYDPGMLFLATLFIIHSRLVILHLILIMQICA